MLYSYFCWKFLGFVTLTNEAYHDHHLITLAEKIRVVFVCNEYILPYTIFPGVIRSSKNKIFSTQHVLWDNTKDLNNTLSKDEYTFPFTIQLPMIQFPPAVVEDPIYKCEYKLIAVMDLREGVDSLRKELPVVFMPLIETTLLKSPMVYNTTVKDQGISASVKLNALDFVPGDPLVANLKLESSPAECSGKKQSITKSVIIISELYQTIEVHESDDISDQVNMVSSSGSKELSMVLQQQKNAISYNSESNIELQLPVDLTPSFSGNLVSVSYALRLRLEKKGPFGGIWKQNTNIGTYPLTIGTLGYGIRSSDSLENYTAWNNSNSSASSSTAATNDNSDPMTLPKFVQDVEYEGARR